MDLNVTERVKALINVENKWNVNVVRKSIKTSVAELKINIFPSRDSLNDLKANVYTKNITKDNYFMIMSLNIIAKSNKQLTVGEANIKVTAIDFWNKIASFEIKESLIQKHKYMFEKIEVLTLLFVVCVVDLYMLMDGDFTQKFGSVKLLSDMEKLMKDINSCDAIVCAGSSKFPVHKYVLSTRSPVFKAMFEIDMLEHHTNIVLIEDMTALAVEEMIYCIYTGRVRTSKTDVLLEIYSAGEKYFLCDLKQEAGHILSMNMNDAVVRDVAASAYLHRDLHLLKRAVRYIYQNKESVFHSCDWQSFLPQWDDITAAVRRSSFEL